MEVKIKILPQQAEVAQGFSGRLRPRIFLTFDTTRVVGRQPYPSRNPWHSFLEAESTRGHMVLSVATEKIPSNTTGNRSRDRPTSSAVPLTTKLTQAPFSGSNRVNYSEVLKFHGLRKNNISLDKGRW
jgi:hypothetical protein